MGRRLALLLFGMLVVGGVGLAVAMRPPVAAVPGQGVVVSGVTVVNPGEGALAGQEIAIRGGRIDAIRASAEAERPAGSEEFAGATVVPGLIDLHVHHPPAWAPGERTLFGLLFLAHGVTSVRDTGTSGSLDGLAQAVASGVLAGPRVFHCGEVLDGDPPVWPTARAVVDAAEARAAVAEQAAAGAACVKVYNRLPVEALDAVREAAAEHGLPLVGHVSAEASLIGMAGGEVQHFTGLTRSWWEVEAERLDWYAETSRDRGISHTPTLVAFDRQARLAGGGAGAAPSRESQAADAAQRWLPGYYRDLLWSPDHNRLALEISPAGGSTVVNRIPVMLELVAVLDRLGVPVRVGTDTGNPFVVPGASLHEELGWLARAGLPLPEVWQAATREAGEVLGEPGLGVIRVGAPADLLVFREDPTRDLAALASLEAVVADGRLYRRAELEAALDAQATWFARPWVDALDRAAARLALDWMERRRSR